jgi:hypothetical protein
MVMAKWPFKATRPKTGQELKEKRKIGSAGGGARF